MDLAHTEASFELVPKSVVGELHPRGPGRDRRPHPEGNGALTTPDLSHTPSCSRVKAACVTPCRPKLLRVVNATGVVIHTNLKKGKDRSLLAQEAVENLAIVAAGYTNLEYDLARGGAVRATWW